jgi:hypothetical protein
MNMWNEVSISKKDVLEEMDHDRERAYEIPEGLQQSFLQISSYLYEEGKDLKYHKKYDIEEGNPLVLKEDTVVMEKHGNKYLYALYYTNAVSIFFFWMFYHQIHKPVKISRETENSLPISFIYVLHLVYSLFMYNAVFRSSIVIYKSFDRCFFLKKKPYMMLQDDKSFFQDIYKHTVSLFQSSVLSIPVFVTIKISPMYGMFSFGCMAFVFAEYIMSMVPIFTYE